MANSKLVQVDRRQGRISFNSDVQGVFNRDLNKKVISIIGKQNFGKSTLLNQIIGQASPFKVIQDLKTALERTTEGIDFYESEESIFLDTEGVGTIDNQNFESMDDLVLLSTISISTISILITSYNDMNDPGGFSYRFLSCLFVNSMRFSQDRKELVIVIQDQIDESLEPEFRHFIECTWNQAYENFSKICAEELNPINAEEYQFYGFFELKILFGEFSKKKREYDEELVNNIREIISLSDKSIQLLAILDRLNEILNLFNEESLPNPRSLLNAIALGEKWRIIIRQECSTDSSDLNSLEVFSNLREFIAKNREEHKNKVRDFVNYEEETRKLLCRKIDQIFDDIIFEWASMLINYARAQVKYYFFKITCANRPETEQSNQNMILEELRLNFLMDLDNFEIRDDLKKLFYEESGIYEIKIKEVHIPISNGNILQRILKFIISLFHIFPLELRHFDMFKNIIGLYSYLKIFDIIRDILDITQSLRQNHSDQLISRLETLKRDFKNLDKEISEKKERNLMLKIDGEIIQERYQITSFDS